jgi:hypothetical protein
VDLGLPCCRDIKFTQRCCRCTKSRGIKIDFARANNSTFSGQFNSPSSQTIFTHSYAENCPFPIDQENDMKKRLLPAPSLSCLYSSACKGAQTINCLNLHQIFNATAVLILYFFHVITMRLYEAQIYLAILYSAVDIDGADSA